MTDPYPSHHIAVIGAGPAGLIAAEFLSARGFAVSVFDQKPSVGRKLLMAGRGGLNLTHSEPLETFLPRYSGGCADIVRAAVRSFTPQDLTFWCEGLGQESFVGSSGRVFPRALKASPLLRAWIARLNEHGVQFRLQHRWTGWNADGNPIFETPDGQTVDVRADACLLALGGASWPSLGSDGRWLDLLASKGLSITPLKPANCGFECVWSPYFREHFAGTPLKSVRLSHKDKAVQGEIMITAQGMEGGAVYAICAPIRSSIEEAGEAHIQIDLRPMVTEEELRRKLSAPRARQSFSTFLQKTIHLSPASIALLREVHQAPQTLSPDALAALIKSVPLTLISPFGLERAISTAGGLGTESLEDGFRLRGARNVFAAGEMLDWEAPTGGYLLQGCLATGIAAARSIETYLSGTRE